MKLTYKAFYNEKNIDREQLFNVYDNVKADSHILLN